MLILMLSNDTFDALLHGQSIQNVQIERPIPIIESIQKIVIVRSMNVNLGVLDALNSNDRLFFINFDNYDAFTCSF